MIEQTKLQNGIDLIRIKNEYLDVLVSNYGCTLMQLSVKDRYGCLQDVLLGYDTIDEYMRYDGYLGALVGRVANRIKNAEFELNGKTFHLAANHAGNTLHGGVRGFSYRVFDYKLKENGVCFHYLSADREEGFPGNLHLYVEYLLEKDALVLHYRAECDQDTLINITNHAYFNLSGKPDNIASHYLRIHADHYACIDENGLVTGELENVTDTPFDFQKETLIEKQLRQTHPQLILGAGFDHPFIFNRDHDQVVLYCASSGIECRVSTTYPLAQIYTANYLDGRKGKKGQKMEKQCAVCIETQYMPDSIHVEKQPKTILRKGSRYDETTSYRFRVR